MNLHQPHAALAKEVRVANQGSTGTLAITSVYLDPSPAFGIVNSTDCAPGEKMESGHFCFVRVVFTPPELTSPVDYSGRLVVTDGTGTSMSVTLKGRAEP